MRKGCLRLGVRELQETLRRLLEGHRQVVLRATLDERRQVVAEGALAQLVVVIVDLPRALGRHDHEGVARIDVLQQVVKASLDHRPGMVAAGATSPETSWVSSLAARSRMSFSIT